MTSKVMSIAVLVAFIACATLSGCSTGQSLVWVDDKASFAGYTALEIKPVFDATDGRVPQDLLKAFTRQLTAKFEGKNVPIETSSQVVEGVLTVKSDILIYESCRIAKTGTTDTGLATPSPGGIAGSRPITKSVCTVRTQLLDKPTNKIVAEIYTTKEVGACFTSQFKNDWLLDEMTLDIVDRVVTIMTTQK